MDCAGIIVVNVIVATANTVAVLFRSVVTLLFRLFFSSHVITVGRKYFP